jgi:hypothetical protein
MKMYDASSKLTKFYDDHVRLGVDRRAKLATHRDACLQRLQAGLAALAEEGARKAGKFNRSVSQGSYIMHTLNQQRDDDYDLDEGVIFKKDALPESALDARKRVEEALLKAGGNFSKPPEARANAVTVYYAEGHHIDLAVYREIDGPLGSYLEHAGPDWTKRDPSEVTEWFKQQVTAKEPWALLLDEKTVPDGQLRRVVRFVKAFAKSRSGWCLPGGMILTVLTAEVFVADFHRDDVALYKTLVALRNRLRSSITVHSPVDGSLLTHKPEREAEVRSLRDRLSENVPKLDVLLRDDCTEAQALGAWNWIFKHQFWGDAKDDAEAQEESSEPYRLAIDVGVARERGGNVYRSYFVTSPALQKKLWLRFRIKDARGLEGAKIRWLVKNSGDEAEAANHLTHETMRSVGEDQWESTAYKGTHWMVCEAYRGNELVAQGRRRIRIGTR